ncbi:hypothetical protein BC943DRAFT_333009 [Umbelopsis sp. AD052]|nr:hypothetical protein BC943DRAFT_333009 [Umbelopsis sp. AD052]
MRLFANVILISLVSKLHFAVGHAADVHHNQEPKIVVVGSSAQVHKMEAPAMAGKMKLWKEEDDKEDECYEDHKDWHHDDDKKKKHKHCTSTRADPNPGPSTFTVNTSSATPDPDVPTSTSISTFVPNFTSSTTESSSSVTSEQPSTTADPGPTTTMAGTDIPVPTFACTNNLSGFQQCVDEGVSPVWYWCATEQWVVQTCDTGTVCRQGDDGGVYCDFP